MVKKISASGANVLLIQKSILKDATNELSLHFLAKKGIMVVQDVERDDIDFICKTIGAIPIAHIDHMSEDKFGHAKLCEQPAAQKRAGNVAGRHAKHDQTVLGARKPKQLDKNKRRRSQKHKQHRERG